MLERAELERAVDMQQRSYRLLRWLATAVQKGFIEFHTAHTYTSLPQAAEQWMREHYLNFPSNARIDRAEMSAFAAFFSTYLENSFDLVPDPGKRLYSPDAHCFCPICSWLVDAPHLKAKRLTHADKRRAEKLRAAVVERIAIERGRTMDATRIAEFGESNREDASLVAYGYDLISRMRGIANGAAILALWRGFAWTRTGSPKPGFKLRAADICDAEQRLGDAVSAES